MSNKKIQQEPDELQNVEQALSKTEQFIENNRKQLLSGLGIVLVVAIAIVWFFNGYVAPKNEEAADKMAAAVRYFELDSFALALNGDGMNEGFIEIIELIDPSPPKGIAYKKERLNGPLSLSSILRSPNAICTRGGGKPRPSP